MNKNEKNARLMRALYLELTGSGLGSVQAALSCYKNFPHAKTTGWIMDEYNHPVIAYFGDYYFDFCDTTVYHKIKII